MKMNHLITWILHLALALSAVIYAQDHNEGPITSPLYHLDQLQEVADGPEDRVYFILNKSLRGSVSLSTNKGTLQGKEIQLRKKADGTFRFSFYNQRGIWRTISLETLNSGMTLDLDGTIYTTLAKGEAQQLLQAQQASTTPSSSEPQQATFKKQHRDVESLYGLRPDQLGLKDGVTQINNPPGWKTIYLGFNNQNRLASISYIPNQGMTLAQAKELAEEELGLVLRPGYQHETQAVQAYRNMPGKIRTINFGYDDPRSASKRVVEISAFFSIGWKE